VLTYKNGNGQLEYLEKSVPFEKVTEKDISVACISDDGRCAVSGGLEEIFLWDMETESRSPPEIDINYIGSVTLSATEDSWRYAEAVDRNGKMLNYGCIGWKTNFCRKPEEYRWRRLQSERRAAGRIRLE
jgi:hypothetical protein